MLGLHSWLAICSAGELVIQVICNFILKKCNTKNSNYDDDWNSLYINVNKFPGLDVIFSVSLTHNYIQSKLKNANLEMV